MPLRSSARSTCVPSMLAKLYSYMIHGVMHYIAEILVAPVNQTVPVNTTTNFFCRARGQNLRWFINGTLVESHNRQMHADSGITFDETPVSDSDGSGSHTFNATITVNASVAINTTNFTCAVIVGTMHSLSDPAQLIVMGKYLIMNI